MENKTMLSAFNNIIVSFLEDLIETYPEENDFKVFKNGILTLKKYNPRKVLNYFKIYTEQYKEQIVTKDINFFINTDSNQLTNSQDNYIIQIIDKLKNYWIEMSDNNKEKIWEYLNTLIKISSKC